jgi:hypothetical protein
MNSYLTATDDEKKAKLEELERSKQGIISILTDINPTHLIETQKRHQN